jgi:hypothetical protein
VSERITDKGSASRDSTLRVHRGFVLIFLLIISSLSSFGQTDPANPSDSSRSDTVQNDGGGTGLEARVDYSAEDSMIYDRLEREVSLYGNAKVDYKKIHLEAARIDLSFEDRTVVAYGVKDSTGKMIGEPVMKEGEQSFDAGRIRYNFKTKKGVIQEVHTQQGKGDLYSERTKKHPNGEIHVKKGKYTTCTLKDYYLRFNKAVVIPDDKIVSGPANLVVGGIPTPLFFPFGYYPQTEGGSSGLLLPRPGETQELGFSLEDLGYYWRFDPYMDTRIMADIYSKGSWALRNRTRYKKRYRYQGNIDVNFSRIVRGDPELPNYEEEREFFIRWRHAQDPKARPNSRFSANVNLGSKDNFRNAMSSSSRDYLSNTFQSNIDHSKNWAGSPFNLNTSLRHSQNTRSGKMELSLPDMSLNMNRIYPFEGLREGGSAGKKWYEKIGVDYTANLRNRIETRNREIRSDRLGPLIEEKMRYGMQHRLNATTSLKPGFINITPRIGIRDRWYMQTLEERYDPRTDARDTSTVTGFRNAPEGNASVDLTTKLYGMYQFLGERQTTIRHVLTPNIGFSYRPSTYEEPQRDLDRDGSLESYDPFRRTVFGGPTTRSSGNLQLALINNLEGKYKALADSSKEAKKFQILDNLSIRTSYDLMADSLNWSPVRISGRTTLLENFNIRFQSSFDPYAASAIGRRIDRFQKQVNGDLLRWTRSSLTVGGDLKSGKESDRSDQEDRTMDYYRNNPNAYVDFSIPWNLGFNYNLRASREYDENGENVRIDETVDLNGNFRITEKWKVDFRSGYDPDAGELTYTKINIFRDLGCWEMSFSWVPFGRMKRYSFQINLSTPMLDDLKLQKRERWIDQEARLE